MAAQERLVSSLLVGQEAEVYTSAGICSSFPQNRHFSNYVYLMSQSLEYCGYVYGMLELVPM